MTAAMGITQLGGLYLSRIIKGVQLDDIENEGERLTGGILQRSGLTIKGRKGSMSDKKGNQKMTN